MKKLVSVLFAARVATLATATVAQPASAAEEEICRTSVTNLVDRPDGGHGTDNNGVWALLTYTRTVKICKVPTEINIQAEPPHWQYRAAVTDEGSFVTIAGAHLSPGAGGALVDGVKGTFHGGFTADFSAGANFADYNGKHDGKTYTGAPDGVTNPTTGNWVKSLFGVTFNGSSLNEDWSWTYETCSEKWINANDKNEGDVTGKACPSESASPSASASASTSAAGGALPITGGNSAAIGIVAVGLIAAGAITYLVARRRRIRFE